MLTADQFIYVKASYYKNMCLHNCKELNVWTAATHISLKCRLALDCIVHRMLKLGYISWGGSLGVVRALTQEEHLTAAVAVFKCFHKCQFIKQTETLYSINLISNLLVFSLK